jgi:hypothetical protein
MSNLIAPLRCMAMEEKPQTKKKGKNNDSTDSAQKKLPPTNSHRTGADRRRAYAYACRRESRVRFYEPKSFSPCTGWLFPIRPAQLDV